MKAVGVIFGMMLATSAQAAVESNVLYILGDHLDGQLTDLPEITYGLRLDDFATTGSGGDGSAAAATFSTTQDSAYVTLLWEDQGTLNTDDDIATVSGTLTRNSDNSVWEVNYVLSDITAQADGFVAGSGSGYIANGATIYDLSGEMDSNDQVFVALADGHRLPGDATSEVARGWLLPNGSTDDWLVTLTAVPIPAALPFLFVGLFGLSLVSRKRSV